MKKYILDAGPLITCCKFKVAGQPVIDHLLLACDMVIVESVRDEVVIAGAHYADARIAQERIDSGKVIVLSRPQNSELEALISSYRIGQGERDSIMMLSHSDLQNAVLIIDDHLAYLVSSRLGQNRCFLLDAIIELVNLGNLERSLARQIVTAIQSRYPKAFVEHTILLLRR